MANTVPLRSKINKQFTWNAESVFKSPEDWDKEIKQIIEDISKIKPFQGRLAESPSVLLEALGVAYELVSRAADRIHVCRIFLRCGYDRSRSGRDAQSRRRALYGQVLSAVSVLQPEILAIGKDNLDEWMSHPSGEEAGQSTNIFR